MFLVRSRRSNVLGALVAMPYVLFMLGCYVAAITGHDGAWVPLVIGGLPLSALVMAGLWLVVAPLATAAGSLHLARPGNPYGQIPPPVDHLHAIRPLLDCAEYLTATAWCLALAVLFVGPNTLLIQQVTARLHRRCTRGHRVDAAAPDPQQI